MKLYDLGHVPWIESQLIYHAMPRLGMEGILYIAPAMPYVCIGCHQDVEQDIDLDFCRAQGIPVFRRQIGRGRVYLDGDQIFYQIILHQDNPLAAGGGQGLVDGRPLAELGGRAIPLRKSLELVAEALVQGQTIPKAAQDLLGKPIVPHWVYRLMGGFGWKQQAKRHGAQKLLRQQPYAVGSE